MHACMILVHNYISLYSSREGGSQALIIDVVSVGILSLIVVILHSLMKS